MLNHQNLLDYFTMLDHQNLLDLISSHKLPQSVVFVVLVVLVLIFSHVLLEHFLGSSFRIFSNFTMLNQSPRTGLDARDASSIYIGPDVINRFTLILLNKNPKIYESIIRIRDWSQPYDFSKWHDASISQTLNCISPCLIKTCQNLLVVTQT